MTSTCASDVSFRAQWFLFLFFLLVNFCSWFRVIQTTPSLCQFLSTLNFTYVSGHISTFCQRCYEKCTDVISYSKEVYKRQRISDVKDRNKTLPQYCLLSTIYCPKSENKLITVLTIYTWTVSGREAINMEQSFNDKRHNEFCLQQDSLTFLRATAYNAKRAYAIAIPSVCPSVSVRLSVIRVDQSKTMEVRIVQFSPYSSPIPLVFVR